jgi:hypothetical protein
MRLLSLGFLASIFAISAFAPLTSGDSSVAVQKKYHDPNIADSDPLTPEAQLKTFHLPPGFIIELVAAEPKIKKPINIAFDAHGRLWVTGSEEYPFAAPPDRKPKDTVKILEDFDEKGLARKVTTFADGLNIPIGVLPTEHGAIVYSIPNIWKLTDSTGSGVADKARHDRRICLGLRRLDLLLPRLLQYLTG